MGSIQVDDTDQRFNYKDSAWTAGGQSGEFDGTSHTTTTAGAQVMFGPFSGSSIQVYSTLAVGTSPKVHFQVDGGAQNVDVPAQMSSTTQFQKLMYSANNLDTSQTHMLQINVLDPGPFTLDYVLIGTSNLLAITPTTSPPPLTTVSTIQPVTTIFFSTAPTTTTPISTPTTSTLTTSTTTLPAEATTDPGPSNPVNTKPAGSVTPFTATPVPSPPILGALSKGGPNMAMIGSVIGGILFLGVVVAALLFYLRRRRLLPPPNRNRRSISKKKPSRSDSLFSQPRRPSLHLDIPNPLAFSRNSHQKGSAPLLPTHKQSLSGSTYANPSAIYPSSTSSQPANSATFINIAPRTPSPPAEDPSGVRNSESDVLDITQRPVSGMTMTTRVTVGTTIGQRVSMPDSTYAYPYTYPDSPVPVPVPAIPPTAAADWKGYYANASSKGSSPIGTHVASTTGTGTETGTGSIYGFSRNPTVNTSSPSERGTLSNTAPSPATGAGTGLSPSRRLPIAPIPPCLKVGSTSPYPQSHDYDSRRATPPAQSGRTRGEDILPPSRTSYDLPVDAVVHQDAGVSLASSTSERRRVDLPPDYNSIGF